MKVSEDVPGVFQVQRSLGEHKVNLGVDIEENQACALPLSTSVQKHIGSSVRIEHLADPETRGRRCSSAISYQTKSCALLRQTKSCEMRRNATLPEFFVI